MSALDTPDVTRRPLEGRRVHFGDLILQSLAGTAALGVVVILGLIAYKVIEGARLSMSTFGLGFISHVGWDTVHNSFGALQYIFGTAVVGIGALVLATPVALGIALYLSELAPSWVRGPVTALVETIAAIPSVIVGLWGLIFLGPFLTQHVDPTLHSVFGFIPLFGALFATTNLFVAVIVLTLMILPIISSISRELFLGVPPELKEAALGLGLTRWEMVRGVVLPYTRGGVAAAMILGLGRAIGEAIAVAQVSGGFVGTHITWNLFNPGDTLASRIASEFSNATSTLELSSLFYLAVILLVLSLIANFVAQYIVRRSARSQGLNR